MIENGDNSSEELEEIKRQIRERRNQLKYKVGSSYDPIDLKNEPAPVEVEPEQVVNPEQEQQDDTVHQDIDLSSVKDESSNKKNNKRNKIKPSVLKPAKVKEIKVDESSKKDDSLSDKNVLGRIEIKKVPFTEIYKTEGTDGLPIPKKVVIGGISSAKKALLSVSVILVALAIIIIPILLVFTKSNDNPGTILNPVVSASIVGGDQTRSYMVYETIDETSFEVILTRRDGSTQKVKCTKDMFNIENCGKFIDKNLKLISSTESTPIKIEYKGINAGNINITVNKHVASNIVVDMNFAPKNINKKAILNLGGGTVKVQTTEIISNSEDSTTGKPVQYVSYFISAKDYIIKYNGEPLRRSLDRSGFIVPTNATNTGFTIELIADDIFSKIDGVSVIKTDFSIAVENAIIESFNVGSIYENAMNIGKLPVSAMYNNIITEGSDKFYHFEITKFLNSLNLKAKFYMGEEESTSVYKINGNYYELSNNGFSPISKPGSDVLVAELNLTNNVKMKESISNGKTIYKFTYFGEKTAFDNITSDHDLGISVSLDGSSSTAQSLKLMAVKDDIKVVDGISAVTVIDYTNDSIINVPQVVGVSELSIKGITFCYEMESGNKVLTAESDKITVTGEQIKYVNTSLLLNIVVKSGESDYYAETNNNIVKYYASAKALTNANCNLVVYYEILEPETKRVITSASVNTTAQKQTLDVILNAQKIDVKYSDVNFAGILAVSKVLDGSYSELLSKNVFDNMNVSGKTYLRYEINNILCYKNSVNNFVTEGRYILVYDIVGSNVDYYMYDKTLNSVSSAIISIPIKNNEGINNIAIKSIDGSQDVAVFNKGEYNYNKTDIINDGSINDGFIKLDFKEKDFQIFTIADIFERKNISSSKSLFTINIKSIKNQTENVDYKFIDDDTSLYTFNGKKGFIYISGSKTNSYQGIDIEYELVTSKLAISQQAVFGGEFIWDGETLQTKIKATLRISFS
ncbi:MAG: hypothetical protein RR334_02585 [Clostridia bacterium]